jgi:hypothetical protein
MSSQSESPLGTLTETLESYISYLNNVPWAEVESLVEEIRYFSVKFALWLQWAREAKAGVVSARALKRIEKYADEIQALDRQLANDIRAKVQIRSTGKHWSERDQLGQGVGLIVSRLESANITYPYYWAALLLTAAGAPHESVGVTAQETEHHPDARIPDGATQLPELPDVADTVNERLRQRSTRWERRHRKDLEKEPNPAHRISLLAGSVPKMKRKR